jgi:hypothetical protein
VPAQRFPKPGARRDRIHRAKKGSEPRAVKG